MMAWIPRVVDCCDQKKIGIRELIVLPKVERGVVDLNACFLERNLCGKMSEQEISTT